MAIKMQRVCVCVCAHETCEVTITKKAPVYKQYFAQNLMQDFVAFLKA